MNTTDYLSTISGSEKKEALLVEAATKHPKVVEAYLRDGNYFYDENEKTFVETAPVELLELFAKKGNTVDCDNEDKFREKVSQKVLEIYDGEVDLTDEEKEALELTEDFLNEEELAVLKEIAGEK